MKEVADKGWICSSDRIVRSNDRSSLGRDQIVTLSSWLNTRFCRVQQKLSVTRGTLQLGREPWPTQPWSCAGTRPSLPHPAHPEFGDDLATGKGTKATFEILFFIQLLTVVRPYAVQRPGF
ncbi:unnamed protein product, partial [Nesidiocoris tenuis]